MTDLDAVHPLAKWLMSLEMMVGRPDLPIVRGRMEVEIPPYTGLVYRHKAEAVANATGVTLAALIGIALCKFNSR